MTAKAIERAQNAEKRQKMLLQCNTLRKQGFRVSGDLYALYSDYKIKFDNHRGIKFESTRINPAYICLGETFLRPYSTLCISEAQTYFNARTFQKFTTEQARFFQTSGHFGVDIYLDTQDIDTIDKTIRNLCEIYEIKERVIINNRGREIDYVEDDRDVKKIIFKYEYRQDIFAKPDRGKFEIDYNVFDCYNSFENFNDYLPEKGGTII